MEIELLQEERLRYWCGRLEFPESATEALVEVACKVRANPDLLDIFNTFYVKTTLNGEWLKDWSDLPFDPVVQEKLGTRTSLFYLLGYLAALPQAEREYRRLGVSLDIFHDTMLDFVIWLNQAYDLRGYWNFDQFAWMSLHVSCELFRLGRLQYRLSEFPGKVTAFRHRTTGTILLLGDPDTPLRADGYAKGAGGKSSEDEPTWHAVFEETPAGWRGNRIHPQGFTLHEESLLLHSEWERILKHGDTVLDLHIPRGDKLTVKECRESIQVAHQFFPEIFPDRPFKGLFCHTWLFTPQLQKILPPESNVVRFQREFYLYPYPGSPQFLWDFVFGEKYPDATTAPRDTSLRRAVLDWMGEGNELFDLPGLMLHSPDQWGSQPYYTVPNQASTMDHPQQPLVIFPELPRLENDEDDIEEETIDFTFSEFTETEMIDPVPSDESEDTHETDETDQSENDEEHFDDEEELL